ncbi:hypothetical protein, partial [Chryseobacterium sp. MDT2-18]|uniref:hypothetical protein n=1 Tax=Chryseobacterium sp. MDT2-18 TaxID=1259136 RepID=UPI0027D79D0F
MKLTYQFIFLFCICVLNKAQSNIKDIFPISPEMSGLVKKVDIPVNYSSGAINYSLNLYTLKLRNLELPLTLSYVSTGFKPSENASNIGLGWDLEIGGKIFQNIRGLNDLHSPNENPYFPSGFPVDRPLKMGYAEYVTNMSQAYNHPEYQFLRENSNSIMEQGGEFISGSGINADSEPDIFYYSFPGKSGKFFLDKSMNGRQMPLGKEVIRLESNGFKIIDTLGNIYEYFVFDNIELNSGGQILSGGYPVGGQTSQYTSSFFLSKIYSKNDIAEFIYDDVEYGYSNPISYTKGVSDGFNLPPGYAKEFEVKNTSEVSKHHLPILKKIKVNGKDRMLFNYNNVPRYDVKNHFAKKLGSLASVIIKDEGSTFNINFFQSYFGDSVNPDSNNSWLKLDSLAINDQHYSFDYHNGFLPEKSTEIKDAWGYFTVPHYNGHKRYNNKHFKEYFYNEGKAPNKEATQLTVLKKITYPTKGEDNFMFESNTYNEYNYKEYNCTQTIKGLYPDGGIFDETLPPFTLYERTIVTLQYNIPPPFETTTTTYLKFSLINVNDNSWVALPSMSGLGQTEITLSPGTYILSMQTAGLPDPYLQLFWTGCEITYQGQKNLEVGGLRLSQIVSKDHNGTAKYLKKINYNQNGISTGKLYDYPIFYDLETVNWIKDSNDFCYPLEYSIIYKKYYSNSLGEISGYNGNPVFYSKVEENTLDITNKDNGKTVYTFLHFDDQPLYYNNYFLTFNDNSWKRGYLTKKEIYKHNEKLPIKTISTEYNILETPQINTVESGLGFTPPSHPNEYHRMSYKFFVTKPQYAILKHCALIIRLASFDYIGKKLVSAVVHKEKEILQENLKGEILEKITNYAYENPSHAQLTKESIVFPDLSTQETIYTYAHEKGNQYLIDKNMIGIPLETEGKKNGVVISKTETKYPVSQLDADAKTSGLQLPYQVYSRDLQSTQMDKQVSYDQYDDKGNLQQYSTKSGVPTAIIWGYNQTQPIAKIDGATYAQVSASAPAIIAASDYGNPNYSEAILLDKLDAFRTSLPNYQIST